MFTLRCVFWLSVMFAVLALGGGAQRTPRAVEAAVASQASAAGAAVMARAADWCAERPARCAQDAASLNALVRTIASRDPVAEEDPSTEAPPADVPLPVRDPRRRAHAVLTQTR